MSSQQQQENLLNNSNTNTSNNNNIDSEKLQKITEDLYKSLTHNPVNEKAIVNILSTTTNFERQQIRTYYKEKYNYPIQNDIKQYLSSKFKDLCISMFDSPFEYDAREIHKAFHSFMNDDRTIVEIFVSRPKQHLEIVNEAYIKFFQISLKDELKKKTAEEYNQYLTAIMDTERPTQQTINGEDAYEIAREMKIRGMKSYCKDVKSFVNIFLKKSREDLIMISRAYFELFGKNLYEVIDSECSGKNKRVIKAVLFETICPAEWFSHKILQALEGLSVDNNTLNRILISRSELDMYALRDYYYIERKTDMFRDIKADTSGSYGEVLVNLSLK